MIIDNNNSKIQIIQIEPSELINLISETVTTEVSNIVSTINTNTSDNENEFLTRKETAKFFKTSLVTIHKWTNDELIKHYKIGGRTYYRKSELVEVLLSSNID